MASDDFARFSNLTFERFRSLASDSSLSKYEKIGFPDSYRAGYETAIFADIRRKLTNLDSRDKCVVDVGPGASDLPVQLIELCRANGHRLIVIDSAEMLSLLPSLPFMTKLPARFPEECSDFIDEYASRVDAVLTYSVLQYVFVESSVYNFLDSLLSLLAPQGQLLVGDIPNISRRKRFFSSAAGVRFHKDFTKSDEAPEVRFNTLEPGQIDDAAVLGIIARARNAGYDAYLVPQAPDLPMANRREDVLIVRP